MEALAESLRDLGAQHVHWGTRPEDYATARDALVAAIGALSPDWSPSLESEWRAAITAIVGPNRSPPKARGSRRRTEKETAADAAVLWGG